MEEFKTFVESGVTPKVEGGGRGGGGLGLPRIGETPTQLICFLHDFLPRQVAVGS